MKALILAAGYATRLYPLTENQPKALLEVGGKTILDWLLDQILTVPEIDRIRVISNSRFAARFEKWRDERASPVPIEVLDDGTATNETRLGAIGDIQMAIARASIDDDMLVVAADNILLFALVKFVGAFHARRAAHICARHVEEVEARRRTGIVVLGEDERVLEFQEKPREPKTSWGVPPLYIYPRETLPRFQEYLSQGGYPDAPGNFIEWLIRTEPVYAWKMDGEVLDIGSLDSLQEARRRFESVP